MLTPLHTPPADCPNDGVCVLTQPQLAEHSDKINRHEKALERIGEDMEQVKKDVHEIRVTLREKDQMMNFLRTVFLSLLGVFATGVFGVFIQISATVWWASQLNTTMESSQRTLTDLETRMRSEELDSAARRVNANPNQQPTTR